MLNEAVTVQNIFGTPLPKSSSVFLNIRNIRKSFHHNLHFWGKLKVKRCQFWRIRSEYLMHHSLERCHSDGVICSKIFFTGSSSSDLSFIFSCLSKFVTPPPFDIWPNMGRCHPHSVISLTPPITQT